MPKNAKCQLRITGRTRLGQSLKVKPTAMERGPDTGTRFVTVEGLPSNFDVGVELKGLQWRRMQTGSKEGLNEDWETLHEVSESLGGCSARISEAVNWVSLGVGVG